MNAKPNIDELKHECEEAERLYQEAMKARRLAVAASQEALKAATRARTRFMRAARDQMVDETAHEPRYGAFRISYPSGTRLDSYWLLEGGRDSG